MGADQHQQINSSAPWWAVWATNSGAKGSKNMGAQDAVQHWLTGGLRMPWIEAWNYIYLTTGVIIYLFMCPLQRAATLEWDWVMFVALRNIGMYWITFGGTHHLLYVSAVRHDLVKKGLKFNPKFPGDGSTLYPDGWAPLSTTAAYMLTGRAKELHGMAQHSHDCFMVHVSCLISSALEVGFLHGWASGRLPLMPDADIFSVYSLALMFALPFFRNAHFYATHRMMHCKFLYKHVHSLHHRSVNTGPWSGLSMHPVESFTWFSTVLLHAFCTSHPIRAFHGLHQSFWPPRWCKLSDSRAHAQTSIITSSMRISHRSLGITATTPTKGKVSTGCTTGISNATMVRSWCLLITCLVSTHAHLRVVSDDLRTITLKFIARQLHYTA